MELAVAHPETRRFRAHWGWHVLGGLLCIGWLLTLTAMLWEPDGAAGAVALEYRDLDGALVESDVWMGAYQDDRKLGFVHATVQRTGSGFALNQLTELKVSIAGLQHVVRSDLRIRLDSKYWLERFDFALKAGPLSLSVEGQMNEQGLALELDIGGERGKRVFPMDEPPLFDLALPFLIIRQDLRAGNRYRVRVFDPRTMSNQDTLIEVVGPEALQSKGRLVPAIHLRRSASGVSLDSWIDGDGNLLKEEVEGGLVLLQEDQERARSDVVGADVDDAKGVGAKWLRTIVPGGGLDRREGP